MDHSCLRRAEVDRDGLDPGDEDEGVPLDDLRAWSSMCRSSCDMHVFHGDHFFIHKNKAAVIEIVNGVFDGLLSKGRAQPSVPRGMLEEGLM